MLIPAPLTAAATTVCTAYGLTLGTHFILQATGDFVITTLNKRHSVIGSVSALAIESVAEAAFTEAAQQLGVQAVQQDADAVGDCHIAIGMLDTLTGALDQRPYMWSSETITPSSSNQQTSISSGGVSVADHAFCRVATTTPVYASVGANPNASTDGSRIYIPENGVAFLVVCGGWKAAIVEA